MGRHKKFSNRHNYHPVPKLTEKQQEIADVKKQFLEIYPAYGNIGDALKSVGLKSRNTFYAWLAADEQFEADFEEVKKDYIEKLEKEADRRAIDGVNKPVFYKGQLVTDKKGNPVIIKEYSDTLLIFRLKALAPDVYRERVESKVDVTSDGKPVESVVRVVDA